MTRTTVLKRDLSVSAITAGFLAVLISYAGPLLICFQAAQSAHASPEMLASWVWAISIGAGVSGIALSWWLKAPVVTAWSAPGTALLITLFPHLSLNEAVGAYLTAGAIVLAIGLSGSFDALMRHIPKSVAAGMMAGILFQFGAKAFKAVETLPVLTLCMVAAFLVFKRWRPRYHMLMVLALGVALAAFGPFSTPIPWSQMPLSLTVPVFIQPAWSWASTLSLAIPLVVVSLSGQYLPGMAILRAAGYDTAAKPIMVGTSLASLAVACFGGITIVLAAITAALCTGRDAHEDPSKRYIAGIANGVFYIVGGSMVGAILWLFAALPPAFIAVLAGLALLGAITANITHAVMDTEHREAAILTFLVTSSGMAFLGLGSAFWGVVIGSLAHWIWQPRAQA
ncbi:benzoate membrane transport protein [Aquabacterium commune]|uniref:Benzoate membrane transport protein n=1 Tax=Aquabacterium commune TaxID=70586 RepID=A0A4R6RID9_9BURK|nr:benzoate/H(+) symporter BenE family transporter [Aquabacterium commune]TDP86104.1 benzoate membrane transport protein [Aquabacterium commune]